MTRAKPKVTKTTARLTVVNDQQVDVAIVALIDLACVVRDEPPAKIHAAARKVLDAVNNDAVSALAVAAALIRTDLPVDRWWQVKSAPKKVSPDPCGSCAHHRRAHPASHDYQCVAAGCQCYEFRAVS